MFYLKFLL